MERVSGVFVQDIGIGIIAVAVIFLLAVLVITHIRKRKLEVILDQEYGPEDR